MFEICPPPMPINAEARPNAGSRRRAQSPSAGRRHETQVSCRRSGGWRWKAREPRMKTESLKHPGVGKRGRDPRSRVKHADDRPGPPRPSAKPCPPRPSCSGAERLDRGGMMIASELPTEQACARPRRRPADGRSRTGSHDDGAAADPEQAASNPRRRAPATSSRRRGPPDSRKERREAWVRPARVSNNRSKGAVCGFNPRAQGARGAARPGLVFSPVSVAHAVRSATFHQRRREQRAELAVDASPPSSRRRPPLGDGEGAPGLHHPPDGHEPLPAAGAEVILNSAVSTPAPSASW